jgi:HlyD family secretion protein
LPITVTGRGVLVRPRTRVTFQAQAPGRIVAVQAREGARVQPGDVLAVLDQAEIRKQLDSARSRLAQLESQDRAKHSLQVTNASLQIQQIDAERSALELQRQSLERNLQDTQTLAPILKKRLDGLRSLKADGLIAEFADELVEAERLNLQNTSRVPELQAQVRQGEAQQRQLDSRRQRIGQDDFEQSSARAKELEVLRGDVAVLEVQAATNGRVLASHAGRVVEIAVTAGDVVNPGSPLGTLEIEQAEGPLGGVLYFGVPDAKRIRPGMRVQITPDTVERERFGGMLATVEAVSGFPVTRDGAAALVGSREIVDHLLADGPKIEVIATLEPDRSAPSGYRWSSSSGSPIPLTSGTTAVARVTVEGRAPITYLLPFLRSASGLY